MSEFDLFTADLAAPFLMTQYGDESALRIEVPGNEPFEITAILSDISIVLVENQDDGEIVRREQRTAMVLRSVLNGLDVGKMGLDAVIIETRNGNMWKFDQDTTKYGNIWNTIGMIRKPLVRKAGPHAAV